jgi:hypothetical protein
MAFPLDTAAQNASLDALLGRDITGIPTAWEVALYDAHPLLGGAELAATGGYARASLSNNTTDLPAAVDGLKTSVTVSFGASSGAYSDTATHAVLVDAADSSTRWFVVTLAEEVVVDEALPDVLVQLSATWDTAS